MTINVGAACAQLTQELQHVMARSYAIAPELRDDRTRADVATQVRMFGNDLIDPASEAARTVANNAYTAVWGWQEAPVEWWDTPLAQTIAHVIGYPWTTVPYVTAARILGISRQRVYQLQKKKTLGMAATEKAVTAESLCAFIQARS